MGHSEKFCSLIFEKSESEIVKPYGIWMKALLRRQTKLIGSKWLRNGDGEIPVTATDGGEEREHNPEKSGEESIMGAGKSGIETGSYKEANFGQHGQV